MENNNLQNQNSNLVYNNDNLQNESSAFININNNKIKTNAINIKKPDALIILLSALIWSVFYTICFTGYEIFPLFSFTLFTFISVILLFVIIKLMKIEYNKKAFILIIPLAILSLLNSIFPISILTYINTISCFIIFTIMAVYCVNKNAIDDYELISQTSACIFNKIGTFTKLIFISIDKNIINGKTVLKIFLGIIISLPIASIIFSLLLSADDVFSNIFEEFISGNFNNFFDLLVHFFVVFLAFIYLTGYISSLRQKNKLKFNLMCINYDSIICNTFLSIINFIFIVFCYVQFAYLFTGSKKILPGSIIYSEYARNGFFQLLFVTFINFSIFIFFIKLIKDTLKHKTIKIQLLLLCIFTSILICSSFYRMNIYIETYGFTSLRMQVITFLIMETFMILFSIIYIIKKNVPLIKIYLLILVCFIPAFNIMSSNQAVNRLNINKFYESNKKFELDINNFDFSSVPLLIDLYNSNEINKKQKQDIYNKLNDYYKQIEKQNKTYWQNYNFTDNISKNKLYKFINKN